MTSIRTEALILRSVDFAESDRILHLLVPEIGRLPVIAKGARRSVRRFAGTLDLFNHVTVQVDRRRSTSLARLDQASLIEPFISLRIEAARFALACYLLELLDRLAPEGGVRADTRRLFGFAVGALRAVSSRTTTLIIAHRLSTVVHASEILFIEGGQQQKAMTVVPVQTGEEFLVQKLGCPWSEPGVSLLVEAVYLLEVRGGNLLSGNQRHRDNRTA